MRHHFADMLDREGNYWTMTENRARYHQGIDEAKPGSKRVKVATIGKSTDDWQNVFTFPNLEELTLHEPSKEQFAAIGELGGLQRLRITHARPKSIDVLAGLKGVQELVLEYVSGFSDLSPLRELPRLRALHLENLRKVCDFGGLAGCEALRFLAIDGTLDWKQPVQDFEFLRGLPKLEVLKLWQMKCRAPYPALLPALSLPCLKKFHAHGTYLPVEECALLEEGLSGVDGADWGPYQSRRGMKELARTDARSKLSKKSCARSIRRSCSSTTASATSSTRTIRGST